MSEPLDKELFRGVARHLRPDISRAEFDEAWKRFLELKAQAEPLRDQGIALHPMFGRVRS